MEWIHGQSVAQTIFSCVHLKHVQGISSPLFKAFVRLALYTMQYTYDIIMDAQIYFEEDFTPDLCGFDFDVDISIDTLLAQVLHIAHKIQDILESSDSGSWFNTRFCQNTAFEKD